MLTQAQKVIRAIVRTEEASTELLRCAHELTLSGGWNPMRNAQSVLEAARRYAKAVDALTRVRK